ncbi:TPA: hypothetical protein ACX6SI_001606 [Photobacterium damselae]
MNKDKLLSIINPIYHVIKNSVDFKNRIWVINIKQKGKPEDAHLVAEDDFSYSWEWMIKQNYTQDMIDRVDAMKPSETITLENNHHRYHLMRVK